MKRNDTEDKVNPLTLLFTLSTLIWAVRHILVEDYGYSETKANIAILVAIDAEKQISKLAYSGKERTAL